jgi:hypothetical protein
MEKEGLRASLFDRTCSEGVLASATLYFRYRSPALCPCIEDSQAAVPEFRYCRTAQNRESKMRQSGDFQSAFQPAF